MNRKLMTERVSTFADPLPPAFYPVSLNTVGRRCVIIGDDDEAHEKAAALEVTHADVVRFPDPADVTEDDVKDAFFVISTPQDPKLAAWLRDLADRHRFLLCTIDQPKFGFVAMQAIVSAGPARIGISTGGVAPRVGKLLKFALQKAMDIKFERFLACLASQKIRGRYKMPDDPAGRRRAMIASADGFTVDLQFTYPEWYEEELRIFDPHILAVVTADTAEAAKNGASANERVATILEQA